MDDLARVPLSFPTYAGILGRAAYRAAEQLNLEVSWQAHQVEAISGAQMGAKRWLESLSPILIQGRINHNGKRKLEDHGKIKN